MFKLNWNIPDYLSAGRQYLASSCTEAYLVSQETIGYWDATSVCGGLAWNILRDANSFPYRFGSCSGNVGTFTAANPKWNGQPWGAFDLETFTLMTQTAQCLALILKSIVSFTRAIWFIPMGLCIQHRVTSTLITSLW
jgi:hypothetical protein